MKNENVLKVFRRQPVEENLFDGKVEIGEYQQVLKASNSMNGESLTDLLERTSLPYHGYKVGNFLLNVGDIVTLTRHNNLKAYRVHQIGLQKVELI